jgi:L-ascorbate metabolism protein UlaG (beta-lactamase superfamily)
MGNPAGILITAEGKTVYHAGDTGLFLDMQLIGRLNRIDVALLPIGDNFTMGVDDGVEAVAMLKPQTVVPMHYDTFDVIHADPAEFARKAAATGARVRPLRIGEIFEF